MKKYSILLVIFLFILFYYPPLFSINSLHFIGVISWIYIFFHKKSINAHQNFNKIGWMYLLFIVLTIFLFFIAGLNDNSYTITAMFLFWMINIIPACLVTLDICYRKKYKEIDLMKLLLIVGNLQGILAVLSFVYPDFHLAFINSMVAYGSQDVFLDLAQFRMFGVAANLTYSTPILQGALAMIAFYYAIKKDLKYMLFFPLLAFSAVVNARTSIVIMLVGIIAILLSVRKINFKRAPKVILLICLCFVAFQLLLYSIEIGSPETYAWIEIGAKEINSFLNGESSGYFDYVTDERNYNLPTGVDFLFGKGVRVMGGSKYGFSSDVGWINDIWMGGVIYSTIIYIFYGLMLWDIYRCNVIKMGINKFLSMFFLGIFLVGNFKGYIISSNDVMTMVFLIFLFFTSKQHHLTNMPNKK